MRRLRKHVLGQVEMSATQIKAAEILLRKVVPDVKQVEHTGTVNHVNYDAAILGLLNERSTQVGDAERAPATVQ